ncbi:MAG TPA: hypothetical protein VMU26_12055, partial [Candidatus Polarisedimenticolia bacterium]|nr:hypothetical protein [Candidatus Polarisedimenticolia bacterium]
MNGSGRGVTKTFVKTWFSGSLKIGRVGSGSSQKPKGSFRAKHSQTKLAGQVLQQRSSQQVHGDHGNNFIK